MDSLYNAAIAGDGAAKAELERKANSVDQKEYTILHTEAKNGNAKRVRFILREFAHKNLLTKLTIFKHTALHWAIYRGHTDVAKDLIEAAGKLLPSSSAKNSTGDNPVTSFQAFLRQGDKDMDTALHAAVMQRNAAIVKLLVEADTDDRHIQNDKGKTPMYIAVEEGYNEIVEIISTTCTAPSLDGPNGTTLHAAINNIHKGKKIDKDVILMIINAAKRSSSLQDVPHDSFESLFNKTDESGRTVLELAVIGNHLNLVELLLTEDPAYQHGQGNVKEVKKSGLMRLIRIAMDEGYKEVVELLSKAYEGGRYPGAVALIHAIEKRDKDTALYILRDSKHLVTFVDDEGWTPLHYAAFHEFDSVLEVIIDAQKDLGFQFGYRDMVQTPLLVAAEKGYTSTVIRLMQLWPSSSSSSYSAVNNNGRNILHLAAAENKKEMIQGIMKYCPEKYKDKLLKQQDDNGDTPLHLLISRGCFIPELIKHKGLDTMAKNKRNLTPRDMLYFEDDIIADA